jgi:glycosyltransferase involved in cell wall biosynthesis
MAALTTLPISSESTRDSRVRYHNIPNGGQASALNFGVSNAKGDYVAFIDSDDEYYPHHLSTLFSRAQETKSDFVIGDFDLILCGDEREVGGFYNRGRTISIGDVECITGAIFGRREKIMEIGGFEGEFLDIGLLDKIKKQNYRWDRCAEKTHRYYFDALQTIFQPKSLINTPANKRG